jgi:hypothetical protein
MSDFRRIQLVLGFLLIAVNVFSQASSLRIRNIPAKLDTIQLDTLTIYPNSFKVFCGTELVPYESYFLDQTHARFALKTKCSDSIRIQYRVLPMNLAKIYGSRETSLIYSQDKGDREKYMITNTYDVSDVFGGSSISKAGSISRGISFGNNQDLGVNSTLNLELSGDIAPNLKLLASVSDDNLPIQPDGNTNKLQEFDQIFIQIYNDRFKLIAGDFWIAKPKGYFLTYKKRAQGLTVDYQWNEDTSKVWKTQVSGALSKGKFARQIIPGVEGNQGPYRLKGNENEPFIIVLSGTERVYLDGKLMVRGQEFDYIINYNSAEVVFTSRKQITKDSRIVIEFQYSDQNYARSLFQTSTTYTSEKLNFWLNGYSEQDAKNQSLQQDLTISQKKLLSQIGDTLNLARTNSIDSIGYFENQVLYKLIDSLGYDSVLVYSVDPNLAVYRATFTFVGAGKGDYIFSNFNALGRVYKWVSPIAGISQGDYAPSRVMISPKQKQMATAGLSYKIRKNLLLETEVAYTKNDLNTFSKFDSDDDQSYSNRTRLIGTIPLSFDSIPKWQLETKVEIESLDRNFSPIEQYRAVEFDRDWNIRNMGYKGNQVASALSANFKNRAYGNLNIEGQHFLIGSDYEGLRTALNGKWKQKGFNAQWDGSYLSSKAVQQNEFLRHRSEFSQNLKWFKIGYIDDHELNEFTGGAIGLETNSYQFFDYQFYIANADSIKNNYKLFYRERYDQRSDSLALKPVAKARTAGGEITITEMKNQSLNVVTSYRELKVLNSTLLNQTPENTLLGRIDYELRLLKGALTWNSFYEIGSGLELKREFLYIKVNDGQGVYTWIDYNSDGIKDLNEFEIAQYIDQASYVRVFTPSNEYIKTYSNEFNQSIYWRPERIWASKKGFKKLLSRFSDQARVRINRKTNLFDGIDAFNPFSTQIRDTNLIATNTNLRNSVFFNRTSSLVGGEYTFQDLSSKSLLATGFDSKANRYHEVSIRWNIKKVFSIEAKGQAGTKDSQADYTSGRNYALRYHFVQPSLIYQPSTTFRITLDGRYSQKENDEKYGGEKAIVYEIGSTFKYNQVEKGSLQGGVKMVKIEYDGSQNSALGFEMLEALKPGINYTWNVGYQRSVSKNLQISIQYNGRKSENSKMIHSGGMEVRAFF